MSIGLLMHINLPKVHEQGFGNPTLNNLLSII
jgi:hypothetical protein